MLKVLVPELTGAPCHSLPCLPSQGFSFFDLSFLVDLLKTSSMCLVWTQALAADGSHTRGDARRRAPRWGQDRARALLRRVKFWRQGGDRRSCVGWRRAEHCQHRFPWERRYAGGSGLSSTCMQVVWVTCPMSPRGTEFRFCHYNEIALLFFLSKILPCWRKDLNTCLP